MYNGFKKEEVTDKGAARLSVFSPAASFWIFPACSG
jgi:hypothetical protein